MSELTHEERLARKNRWTLFWLVLVVLAIGVTPHFMREFLMPLFFKY